MTIIKNKNIYIVCLQTYLITIKIYQMLFQSNGIMHCHWLSIGLFYVIFETTEKYLKFKDIEMY